MLKLIMQPLLNKVRSVSIILIVLFGFSSIFMNEVFASQPRNITVSNVGSSRFTVSWTTDIQESAQINYGTTSSLGNIAYDTRGSSFNGTTHYVTISELNSSTTCYYDIISGGVTYNNGGAHFTTTTGKFLDPAVGSDIAYGMVFLNGGSTPAEGTIVYIKLQDNDGQGTSGYSQLCSSLVGSTGYWSLQLKNVRNQALTSYFVYSAAGDNLTLDAIGLGGGAASQVVNTSSDTPAASMTLGPPCWTLNMTEMNWYENAAPYNSTGAAACEMILNYIRSGAGQPLLTQNQIYEYGKAPAAYGPELTPDEAEKALGHFDPYDYLVSNWSDSYNSLPDGNPFKGYNYCVETYDPGLDTDAINKYTRDICHWMAFTVTKEAWWKNGELVARPNTPAAIPIYGSYANWVAVKGCVTSENPCPAPHTAPWNTPNFTVYGFWMKDPRVSGIGQDTYKTAAECQSTYFLPLATGDAYNGLFLQVAEPPAEMSKAAIEIPTPTADLANLDFIGVKAVTKDSGEGSQLMAMSLSVSAASKGASKPLIKKQSWRDLVDSHLLMDSEAVSAFENTKMGKAVFVDRTDEGADYYLVPFGKSVKGKFLASAVVILDGSAGYFKEASWTDKPDELLKVSKNNALSLVRKSIVKNFLKEVRNLPKKPIKNYLLLEKELLRKYTQLLNGMRGADAVLVWEPNSYSASPYEPYWKIDYNGYVWYVTQEQKVISEANIDKILNELEANRIAMQKFYH